MDAFESLIGTLLRRDGYWIHPSFKVELSKEEKKRIGKPSHPRREIDLLAYNPAANEVLAVECKSYLDSRGVCFRSGQFEPTKPYKLFTDDVLREVVLARMVQQLLETNACRPDPTVKLCLAAGKLASQTDVEGLRRHFDSHGWGLFDRKWIKARLQSAAKAGYENDVLIVVAKLLLHP